MTGPSSPRSVPFVVRRVLDRDRLETLLRQEPVNPVDDIDRPDVLDRALADRTDLDRRVYELVVEDTPDRPRTVVWVALTSGTPAALADLTDDRPPLRPEHADTAVFWSIWNVEDAPPGPGSGRDLLDGAVALLREELPGIETFVTLSPVPGLRGWIDGGRRPEGSTVDPTDPGALGTAAARYLTGLGDDGRPIDAVARFHLGNGARLWRINLGGDRSRRGTERSYGVLANYRYEPEDRAANRELLRSGTVATSADVESLLAR